MTRMLVVASPSLSPLSTDEPIPTDGQMQSCPHLEWVKPAAETDYRCCDEQTPYPFTVAVWTEIEWSYCSACAGRVRRDARPVCPRGDDGWRCGWDSQLAEPPVGAITHLVEVVGPSHHADECDKVDGDLVTGWPDSTSRGPRFCHPDAELGGWHTPTGQVSRLNVPTPMERPTAKAEGHFGEIKRPASWWWADIDLEVPA